MPTLYTLSESDVAILKEIVRDYRGGVIGGANHSPYRGNAASETYLAYVSSAGIPAVDGTTPGSATCDIYRINPLTPSIDQVGTSREVFNVTSSDIGEGYIPVVKTKGGAWVTFSSSSEGMKKLCWWTAQEDFTREDEWWWATITDQFGPGTEHTEGGTGTGVYELSGSVVSGKIYNLPRNVSASTSYEFYGIAGNKGSAFWHEDNKWICIIPECAV